jgi:hypothetical protein
MLIPLEFAGRPLPDPTNSKNEDYTAQTVSSASCSLATCRSARKRQDYERDDQKRNTAGWLTLGLPDRGTDRRTQPHMAQKRPDLRRRWPYAQGFDGRIGTRGSVAAICCIAGARISIAVPPVSIIFAGSRASPIGVHVIAIQSLADEPRTIGGRSLSEISIGLRSATGLCPAPVRADRHTARLGSAFCHGSVHHRPEP